MTIKAITDFDGACPHGAKGVRRDRQGRFVFRPGLRRGLGLGEEADGKGSRFSARLFNSGKTEQAVEVVVDWSTPARTEHHDLGYIRHESAPEWKMIPGRRAGALVEYQLKLAPGLTHLGLYPEYNVEQLAEFIAELKVCGVRAEIAGRSREGRPIHLLNFKSPNPKAGVFLIQARDHAYETAGSYCVEGIVRFLISDDPIARYVLEKFNVHILPMTNPDGVFNGMSQRTWERGPRMDQVFDIADGALKTVKRVVDRLKPAAYLDIHNWTIKFSDGLLYGKHEQVAELVRRFMPDDVEHCKRWGIVKALGYFKMKDMGLVDLSAYVRLGGKPAGNDDMDKALNILSHRISHWIAYCEEIHGSVGLAMEFPWFGLNTTDMRAKGRRAFTAMALAMIETRKM